MENFNSYMPGTWTPEGSWGVRVEYDYDIVDQLRGKHLSDEDLGDIYSYIESFEKSAEVEVPSLGLVMDCFDWTTGIDFGHSADGGGYLIYLSDYNGHAKICICVEWDDDFAAEAGLSEERNDQMTCVEIGLNALRDWVDSL